MSFKLVSGWIVVGALLGVLAGCPNPSNDLGDFSPTNGAVSTDAAGVASETADGRGAEESGPSGCITACNDSGLALTHVELDGRVEETGATRLQGDSGADSGRNVGGFDASDATVANDPLNLAARCTSGVMWNGVTGDQNMAPGEACPTCHSNYYLAGTLYPTGHEPNGCDGVNGLTTAVTVQVTDATGNVVTLYANAAGNFYTSIVITPPYQAKVVQGGTERAMIGQQTNTSCNGCHTEGGTNGAPGRVTLPP